MKFILTLILLSVFALNNATKLSGFVVGGEEAPAGSTFAVRIVSVANGQGHLFSGVACTERRVITVGQAIHA